MGLKAVATMGDFRSDHINNFGQAGWARANVLTRSLRPLQSV